MLGIIGGNGVAATNKLLQLIEEIGIKDGAVRDGHHPEMLIWQATQAPSRSMYLEGRGPSFIEDYIRIGKLMKQCGCTELVMGCNTAHYAIDEIARGVELPFINVVDEVAKYVYSRGYKRAGIMCTDGCRLTNLYEKSFAKYAPDVEIVYPSIDDQKNVTKGICNAKNMHRFDDICDEMYPYNVFDAVANHLSEAMGHSSDCCIVGGCTDIRNVYKMPEEKNSIHYVDSLEVLANVIYQKYKVI